ncbi:MAG TPA: cadherin-like domain-containing protein [Solirubrobacteraceae bacterium]|nr:cadherin-like domain-containing protein [Solirubrobacteraceae bacterium]
MIRRVFGAVLACGLLACLALANTALAAAPVGALAQPTAIDGCASANGNAPGGGSCTNVRGLNDPYSIVVSPDGRNLYNANFNNGVGAFSRSASGALVQLPGFAACVTDSGTTTDDDVGDDGNGCANGRAMSGTRAVAISPDGRNVYIGAETTPASVAVFSRDETTGALTQLAGAAGCISNTGAAAGDDAGDNGDGCVDGYGLGGSIYQLTVSPDGLAVYVAALNGSVAVLRRDPATGALSQDAGNNGCVTNTGATVAGDPGTCVNGRALSAAASVAVTPDGRELIVSSSNGGGKSEAAYFAIDPASHALTQIGCLSNDGTASGDDGGDNGDGCTNVRAIFDGYRTIVSPDGANVYIADFGGGEIAAFSRDAASGVLTQLSGAQGCLSQAGAAVGDDAGDNGNGCTDVRGLGGPFPMAISTDGAFLYVGAFDHELVVLNRDPATGALTQSASTSGCFSPTGTASGDATALGCQTVRGLADATSVQLSPDQAHLYVSGYFGGSTGSIVRFTRGVAPVCTGTSLTTPFQTAVSVPLLCSDANGDALTITADAATGGSVGSVDPASATVTFTPAALFSGAGGFAFRASDGSNTSATASASITVGAAAAPLATQKPVQAPSLASASIRVGKDGRGVTLQLKCAAAALDCAGQVTVSSKAKLRTSKHAKAKVLKLGSASYTVASGKQGTAKFKLSSTAAGLLRKAGSLKVVVALDPTGPVAAQKQNATLLPPKKKKARKH